MKWGPLAACMGMLPWAQGCHAASAHAAHTMLPALGGAWESSGTPKLSQCEYIQNEGTTEFN